MGLKGGSKVEPTAEEYALSEIAAKEWANFVENDIPVQNEAIARLTGLRRNTETGTYEIDPNGPLNADGSIKTDGTSSRAANEAAYSSQLNRVNPNRINRMESFNNAGARQGAAGEINERLGQQTALLQGEQNVVAMGRGEQQQAIAGNSYLATQAHNEAVASANADAQKTASRSALAGNVIGAGAGVALYKGGYLDPTGNAPQADPKNNTPGLGQSSATGSRLRLPNT